MTETLQAAQTDLLCTNCAGQCEYSPQTGRLTCVSCATGHAINIDRSVDPTIEQHYHPDMPHTEQPTFSTDRHFQCETCGGDVIFQGHSISQRCAYCNGVLVERSANESYSILGMIPFQLDAASAQTFARKWIAARWAAPSDLKDIVSTCDVSGIYVPFWTFDSEEAVTYFVTYKTKRGDRTVTKTQIGSMDTAFNDMLMPASPHVTPLIRDGILHEFDPDDLRPYEPAFLAGFAAERHHQTVREGLSHNEADKALLLRNRIKQHSGKSGIVDISYKTDTTGIRYRRILLPVWILHYEYDGNPMKVVTCGLHGRTFGERPFSSVKLLALAVLAASAVAAFGFYWGAMNIY